VVVSEMVAGVNFRFSSKCEIVSLRQKISTSTLFFCPGNATCMHPIISLLLLTSTIERIFFEVNFPADPRCWHNAKLGIQILQRFVSEGLIIWFESTDDYCEKRGQKP
jgi:hypothetical protein